MKWFLDHLDEVGSLLVTHAVLAVIPLVIGLMLAIPLGWLARRYRGLRTPLIAGTGLLYTIPSLALFILMPLVLGAGILNPLNAVVALTIYTVALLVRTVADGLAAVPSPKVKVVDTTGAGDAFVGATVAALAEGSTLIDAARFAARVGAYACTGRGAQPSYPDSASPLPDQRQGAL